MKTSRLIIIVFTIVAALLSGSAAIKPADQARGVITKMLKAMDAHTGCSFTMRSSERAVHGQDLRNEELFTKVNVLPFKVYIHINSEPNKGIEILYDGTKESDKALVNPGKFLPSIRLSPFNGLLTKNEHHTILTSGFGIVNEIINASVKRMDARGKFDSAFKYVGDVSWNGRSCYKVEIDDINWSYTTYLAQKGETMYSIAKKKLIPEYSMMELDNIKSFDEDLGGKTLKVPTTYALKTILYIDKENYFPLFQEMSDDKGVFERYEYFDLVINPVFKADEFDRHFSGYKF